MSVASWIVLSNIYSAGALCFVPKRSTAQQLVRSEAQTNKGQYPSPNPIRPCSGQKPLYPIAHLDSRGEMKSSARNNSLVFDRRCQSAAPCTTCQVLWPPRASSYPFESFRALFLSSCERVFLNFKGESYPGRLR
jgi:hypothetical protein